MAASLSSAACVISLPSLKAKKDIRHLGSFCSKSPFHCGPLFSSRFCSRYFLSPSFTFIICLVAENFEMENCYKLSLFSHCLRAEEAETLSDGS